MTSWSVQTPQFKYYWLGSQKQQIITLIAELKKNPHRLHVNWVNNTRVILHTHLSAVSSTRTLLLCGMTSSSGVKRCLFSLSLSLIVFVGQFCFPALQSPAGSWRALVARFHSSWAVFWPSPPLRALVAPAATRSTPTWPCAKTLSAKVDNFLKWHALREFL